MSRKSLFNATIAPLLTSLCLLGPSLNRTQAAGQPTPPANRARLTEAYGKIPMAFETNIGQMDQRVRFKARGTGYALFLTAEDAALSLQRKSTSKTAGASALIRLTPAGGNPSPVVQGLD